MYNLTHNLNMIHVCFQTQCKHDSECSTGECCYYHEGPMVMSKKRQVLLPFKEMVQGKYQWLWVSTFYAHGSRKGPLGMSKHVFITFSCYFSW